MMRYFKKQDGSVYGFDSKQLNLIHDDMVEMTDEEIDRHKNPEKHLSDEEKLLIYRQNMPTLSPIEFDIKLVNAGLYDQVQSLIQSDIKLKIAYTRATFFSRTDPFIDQARIALNLTDEQVDDMWQQALQL